MKTKNILFAALIVATLFSFSFVVSSITPYYGIVINLPIQIDAQPGQTVMVNGTITNIGTYFQHEFTLTSSGVPSDFNVTLEPNYWAVLPVIRAWDPVNGLYRTGVPFNLTIVIPQSASGTYAVNITGQDHVSWRKPFNSTVFVLRVGGNITNVTSIQSEGTVSVSQIVVPETITQFVPFNVSFDVVNSGNENQTVNISLSAPSDWTITAAQSVSVRANSSLPLVFSVIPSASAGNLAVLLNYPYEATVINVTKAGPYLIPTSESAGGISTTSFVTFVQQNTVLAIIIAIVVIILIWYFASTYSFYSKRKKPEEMKKQIDTTPAETIKKTIDTSSQDEAITDQ